MSSWCNFFSRTPRTINFQFTKKKKCTVPFFRCIRQKTIIFCSMLCFFQGECVQCTTIFTYMHITTNPITHFFPPTSGFFHPVFGKQNIFCSDFFSLVAVILRPWLKGSKFLLVPSILQYKHLQNASLWSSCWLPPLQSTHLHLPMTPLLHTTYYYNIHIILPLLMMKSAWKTSFSHFY